MATATTPRNDIYLSVLAGRAVMALADLAGDPAAWNERVENGLRDGIVFCHSVRARGGRILDGKSSTGLNPLKRSVESTCDSGPSSVGTCAPSEKVEDFLSQLVSRVRKPEIPELVDAIEFFRKMATDR
jgi:hypothetical protein